MSRKKKITSKPKTKIKNKKQKKAKEKKKNMSNVHWTKPAPKKKKK